MNATPVTTDPSSPLLHNLLVFGRLLRTLGLPATTDRLVELATTIDDATIRSKEDFRDAARSLLVSRHEDFAAFDRAFALFWRVWEEPRREDPLRKLLEDVARSVPRDGDIARNSRAPELASRPRALQLISLDGEPTDHKPDDPDEPPGILALYSPTELLRRKDFSRMTEDEVEEVKRLLAALRWNVTRRRSLRARPARSGPRLDVRRSLRRGLRHGGELIDLAYRGPKLKRRQLVLLCDISGSMDRYSRLLLHFLHSVEASAPRVEVFAFGTRLTRVTRELRRRDPDAAVVAVAGEVQDWSGGTRIGKSLQTFNRRWARRVLGHGAVVLIISDGWDRGDPELLAGEMQRLQRASYRLIWLNPLLGSSAYEPLTQGIQAALPWVDDFLPVHNLLSLSALAEILNDVQQGRPSRKQTTHSERR